MASMSWVGIYLLGLVGFLVALAVGVVGMVGAFEFTAYVAGRKWRKPSLDSIVDRVLAEDDH